MSTIAELKEEIEDSNLADNAKAELADILNGCLSANEPEHGYKDSDCQCKECRAKNRKMTQEQVAKEKLFAFDLHELDGERERDVPRLVKAKDIEEAEKKTRHYAARWYPFDTTYQYNKFETIHIFDAGTIYVTVKNLQEVEKRDWAQMMFRGALIG